MNEKYYQFWNSEYLFWILCFLFVGLSLLDIYQSSTFKRYGIKEWNPLHRDENKNFVLWKALRTLAITVLVVLALKYTTYNIWASGIGFGFSMFFIVINIHNRLLILKKIRQIKNRRG